MQCILNFVVDVRTEEKVTVSGDMMEEVTFDLGLNGCIGARLKEKFRRHFWAVEPHMPRDGDLREHGAAGGERFWRLEHEA